MTQPRGKVIKALVERIAKELVDHPDEVTVVEQDTGHLLLIEIRTNPQDVGALLGKKGHHIEAIRTLASNAGAKIHKRVMVEIIDPRKLPPLSAGVADGHL